MRTRTHLALACLAILLAAADTYVVVLALPDMMVSVGLDIDELQRAAPIISGFLLGYIAMLPLIGRLSDLVGRTPVLVASVVLFGLGSLVTAAAYDLPLVVAGRFLQGVGGGGLVPATLALVADLWPPDRRGLPLGVVGAVQELGSVIGPLYGALVLLLADWRMIFWINLACGVVLAWALWRMHPRPTGVQNVDLAGAALALLALTSLTLALTAPEPLASDVMLGLAFVPLTDRATSHLLTPIGVATLLFAVAFVLRQITASRPLVDLRKAVVLTRRVDFPGAVLLGLALSGIVLAFSVADPATEVLSPAGPWLLGGSVVAGGSFVVWQRRSEHPIVPRGSLTAPAAWGALVVSLLIGAALIVALVDVPIFARTTVFPDSQFGAALVLLRFLVALPVGALLGGWLSRRIPPAPLAAAGMVLAAGGFAVMASWPHDALVSVTSDVTLLTCGLGFGLAVAPVNTALLQATPAESHGIASALVVVARMVGMLVGLSALTVIALRRFFVRQSQIPPPESLCPYSPAACPAYTEALRDAALLQLHTTFAGAATCAALAGGVALLALRRTLRLRLAAER